MALRAIIAFISVIGLSCAGPLLSIPRVLNHKMGIRDCSHLLSFKNRLFYLLDEKIPIKGMPADINIDWQRDNIYFTLISNEMKMKLQILYNEDPRRTKDIVTPGLGQSTAIDNIRHAVYLALDNGVYKYINDSIIEPYAAEGEDVMYITVNDVNKGIYIATFPNNLVLKITNDGRTSETFDAIPNGHGLKIDKQGNLYFYTGNTAYVLKKDTTIPIKITGFRDESNKLFFVAKTGQVFAMDDNSRFYIISPAIASAYYLGTFNVQDINAFGIDSENNIIIGRSQEILKFNVYKTNPCLKENIRNMRDDHIPEESNQWI